MMDISDEMQGYIDMAMKMNPRSERTVEFIQPAIKHGLTVLEEACPIGMIPTPRGVRPVYGPKMDGGRYAMILSTEDGGAFTSLTELPDELPMDNELMNADMNMVWGFMVGLLNERKVDEAMSLLFLILQRQGSREKMLMNCETFIKGGFVPLLFCVARRRTVEDNPDYEEATGFFMVMPLPPSIERQMQVHDLGELDPAVIPTPKRRK